MKPIEVEVIERSPRSAKRVRPAPRTGESKPSQLQAVLYLFGALIYFVWPLDFLPDLIPGLCHVDDIALLTMAIQYARKAFS